MHLFDLWLFAAATVSTFGEVKPYSEYLLPPPAPITNDSVILPIDETKSEEKLEIDMIVTIHSNYNQREAAQKAQMAQSGQRSRLVHTRRKRSATEVAVCREAVRADAANQWFRTDKWTQLFVGDQLLDNLPYGQLGKPVLCLKRADSDSQPLYLSPTSQRLATVQNPAASGVVKWLCVASKTSPRICKESLAKLEVVRCSEGSWIYRPLQPTSFTSDLHACKDAVREDKSKKRLYQAFRLGFDFPSTKDEWWRDTKLSQFVELVTYNLKNRLSPEDQDQLHVELEHLQQRSATAFSGLLVAAGDFKLSPNFLMLREAISSVGKFKEMEKVQIVIETPEEQPASTGAENNLSSAGVLKAHKGLFIVVGIIVAIAVALVLLFLLVMYCRHRRRGGTHVMKASVMQVSEEGSPSTMRRVEADRKAAAAAEKQRQIEEKKREKAANKKRKQELKEQQQEREAQQLEKINEKKKNEKEQKETAKKAAREEKERKKNEEKEKREERKQREKQDKEVRKEAERARKRAAAGAKEEAAETEGLAENSVNEGREDGVDNPLEIREEEMIVESVQMQESAAPDSSPPPPGGDAQDEGWVVPLDQIHLEDQEPNDEHF